jgi:hypothetical protein
MRIRPLTWYFLCSPERIRTAVTALRGRRPRPLDDGTMIFIYFLAVSRSDGAQLTGHSSPVRTGFSQTVPNRKMSHSDRKGRATQLGYQDSNLEQLIQNQSCCRLHHTPPAYRPSWVARAR